MYKIKATLRKELSTKEASDAYSMLRGLAANIDGYQTIAGRTNARLLAEGYVIFDFRDQERADRFRKRGQTYFSSSFRFTRLVSRRSTRPTRR
ncbi:hypothetical protein GTY70_05945 [Stenotrophomonas maltophilia]|uniref:hypothetical protein n=1 Tax=Stenotrophomonas pavanii TaxID=487698 RepID=UPI001F15FC21|nr:hypothetical protein [Stenotrophomonas pavanii]MCF3463423.1 hypothetical protein [Stenotrophomonas maltophilia]MCF3507940.1 hypothetical protein [Stenotrophomonas maltophilia]MCU1155817.1 hypothetical protein [Stenotrophomonas maltophilia]MCU1167008.1 hypothetical protein [Stenotrophomonas maltophilia]MCU1213298.1 hypothetical protein [Stenotrophomonas maltophilia]